MLHVQDDYGYEVAQINHYALRSRDGFLIKKARGRANHFKQNIEFDYWKKFDKNEELDDSIVRKFEKCEALKYELFDRNPMLKELHFGGLEQHREKAENLLKDPAFQNIIQRIPRYQQNLKAKQVAVNK